MMAGVVENGVDLDDAEIAKLEEKAAERERARAVEAKQAKLQRLKLIDQFEEELGPRGREFEIVDLTEQGEGYVVVKRALSVHMRAFKASKMTDADHFDLVKTCVVYPTIDEFKAIAGRRDFAVTRCATAIAEMHGLKVRDDAGKR